MKQIKKIVALLLVLVVISTAAVVTTGAVSDDTEEVKANNTNGITVHYKRTTSSVPTIYYWNSLPNNIETSYPGPQMTADANEGTDWYTYTFNDITKINMLFIEGSNVSNELTRQSTGEYWYKNNRWYTSNPDRLDPVERTDFREETIYFIVTTRFYDGDTGNNVHCWDDSTYNNPDSDPAWRGDFKGLIQKLDYIKALGFSAIWVTPVVTNGSGYDYHGYHALDYSTVDVRYESDGATFQDLIDAVHEKGMKIVQDVVWNHTSNFGENTLAQLFTKQYSSIQDLADIKKSMIPTQKLLSTYGLSSAEQYYAQNPSVQYKQRLDMMKEDKYDTDNNYHHDKSLSYGSYTEQTGQMADDCVDINTENPKVAEYVTNTYLEYANMGVDAFRLDTEKHINRWTLNSAYFPKFTAIKNFYLFGEVCARWREPVNEGGLSDSCFFYTWKETGNWASNWSTTSWKSNYDNSIKHFQQYQVKQVQQTSNNAFLNGNDYHTPDYSQANGTGTIDFTMHWNFYTASGAFNVAKQEDSYFNDSTWNVTYVDSHDYSPDECQKVRYNAGTQAWAENLCLMFTFRGIPCVYYGSEIEFKKGEVIDGGEGKIPLEKTGRAYYGSNLEGSVTATDFSEYTASGKVADTLNSPLSKHLSRLNKIRRAIPALQKGQYSVQNVSGDMCYKRGYTNPETGEKSFACIAVTNGATFSSIPNGKYVDAVTGDVKNVTNGTLSISAPGKGNMRVYVLSSNGYTGISGKIGESGTYLK